MQLWRTNQLDIHVYQLLRLWLLDSYDQYDKLPTITIDTIKMAFKVLSLSSPGPKPKGDNKILYDELENLYNNEYKNLECSQKFRCS